MPGDVVGVGSALPGALDGRRASVPRHGLEGPFVLYVGRIDENKGCRELFDFFRRYREETGSRLRLVLDRQAGAADPEDPGIVQLGFLPDAGEVGRPRRLRAAGDAVALREPVDGDAGGLVGRAAGAGQREVRRAAWPVPALERRALLRRATTSSARRSPLLESDAALRKTLGANGRRYFEQNYAWDVVERKYLALLLRARRSGSRAGSERSP